jgi:hypothetical protein
MPGDIRTWHAPDARPPAELFRDEPKPKGTPKAPGPAGGPPKPAASTLPKPPVSRPAQRPRDADGFLHEFVGREVTVYLLAPLGKATGPILTGRLRLVRKYEALLDRPDGPVVLMKAGIVAVEPQPADAANDAPA